MRTFAPQREGGAADDLDVEQLHLAGTARDLSEVGEAEQDAEGAELQGAGERANPSRAGRQTEIDAMPAPVSLVIVPPLVIASEGQLAQTKGVLSETSTSPVAWLSSFPGAGDRERPVLIVDVPLFVSGRDSVRVPAPALGDSGKSSIRPPAATCVVPKPCIVPANQRKTPSIWKAPSPASALLPELMRTLAPLRAKAVPSTTSTLTSCTSPAPGSISPVSVKRYTTQRAPSCRVP